MVSAPTDIDLITKLRKGDDRALMALYDRYSGALYGVILRMCRAEDRAKDLLQESFVRIWKKIDQYDPDRGKFYTWSYRIARNTTLNALRKAPPLIQTEDLSVYKDTAAEENVAVDYTELNGLIRTLEPHHQRALDLVYFNGLTHREAHKEMEVPLGTFKSYVRQALKQLRMQYEKTIVLVAAFLELFFNG